MKISSSFKKQFEWETLQSEKLRAAILAGYALFTFIYILIINFLRWQQIGERNIRKLPFTLLTFLAGLFLYELITNRILSHRLKTFGIGAHPNFKYINAFIELTIITIMLYTYSFYVNHSATVSDVILVSLYYLVVFLSALYLDKIISIVTGVIAGTAYTLLQLLEINHYSSTRFVIYDRYFVYATGLMLFMCGIAAAFMADQLQKGIQRSVKLAEDENKLFTLFSRQISKEVATALLDKDGKMPSEMKFVCVMFIDIRNFTGFAEQQQPEDIVEFQNNYFGLITEIVNQYKGIVNQFLGDGCMITFGAPVVIENPTKNAVQAALEIKKAIEEKIANKEMHEFAIGIGIHSGKAVTGNIGTPLKSEYSITGGVVIIAARIEPLNKTFDSSILISKEALDACQIEGLNSESMGQSQLKGWSSPVEIYKLA